MIISKDTYLKKLIGKKEKSSFIRSKYLSERVLPILIKPGITVEHT